MRRDAAFVDAVLASLLLAACLAVLPTLHRDHAPVVAVTCCALLAGAVWQRRRLPALAALVALAGMVGYEVATHDPNGAFPPVAVALTFYTLGRSSVAQRRRVPDALVAVMGLVACAIFMAAFHASAAAAVSAWLVLTVAPLAFGILLARRSELSRRLAAAAEQLRAEQDRNAAQAAVEERNRVARDLHDVVAHCVSVMVVQAGAARLVAAQSPHAADQALAVIGGCGRDALADLRRIVGVLHRGIDSEFGCGAGVADLQRLAGRIAATGVPTTLHIAGDTRLPPAIDFVAYHVAQEALTNVVKHAGAGASAQVNVSAGRSAVTVEVTNTPGAGPQLLNRSGHGLVGMRERVAAFAGTLSFGRTRDGGYTVQARIPLEPAAAGQGSANVPSGGRIERLWRTRAAWTGNAAIVAGWLIAMEIDAAGNSARRGPWILNAAIVAAMASAAWWRRRSPLLVLAVVGGLSVTLSGGLTSLDHSSVTGFYCISLLPYTVAAWQPRGRAVIGLILWIAVANVLGLSHNAPLGGIAGAVAGGVVVWTAGRVWRTQRTLALDLTETTARLAAERDQRRELAVASERVRIARELHGLVAQGVVSMVVQAEAARNLLAHEPDRAETAVRAIEQAGREALAQLRRILGVLRSSGGAVADLPVRAAA